MGLDQYAFARKGESQEITEEFTYTGADGVLYTEPRTCIAYEEEKEFAYWRKHPNLQGWMEQLWREKGGEGEFNVVEVELTLEDLAALEIDLGNRDLPATQGFFFGGNSDDYYTWQDQEFIRQARQYLADGYKVVYTSWW